MFIILTQSRLSSHHLQSSLRFAAVHTDRVLVFTILQVEHAILKQYCDYGCYYFVSLYKFPHGDNPTPTYMYCKMFIISLATQRP